MVTQYEKDVNAPGMQGPPAKRTRYREALATLESSVAECGTVEEATDIFNTGMYHLFGDASDGLECDVAEKAQINEKTLEAREFAKALDMNGEASIAGGEVYQAELFSEANKAEQNVLMIRTPLGDKRFVVPSSVKDVMESPESEQWKAADEKAVAVVENAGNQRVSLKWAQTEGYVIAPCVMARKVKINRITNELAEVNAFKSRLSVDEPRVQHLLEKKGQAYMCKSGPEISSLMQVKVTLAVATEQRAILTSLDLPAAYTAGRRTRKPIVVRLPASVERHDEDGEEQGLLLNTPLYGEKAAGDELDKTIKEDFRELGWSECENVPATFRFVQPDGYVITCDRIVDDFLLKSRPKEDEGFREKFVGIMRKWYGDGVTMQHDFANPKSGETYAEAT